MLAPGQPVTTECSCSSSVNLERDSLTIEPRSRAWYHYAHGVANNKISNCLEDTWQIGYACLRSNIGSITTFGFETEKQWDYENGFYLTSHPTQNCQADSSSSVIPVYPKPASAILVECGVFKGASFMRFCSFRDMHESSFSRKIIGFDAFGKFPRKTTT